MSIDEIITALGELSIKEMEVSEPKYVAVFTGHNTEFNQHLIGELFEVMEYPLQHDGLGYMSTDLDARPDLSVYNFLGNKISGRCLLDKRDIKIIGSL